jgi:tetratricopeptide (TPR) repeat protein
VPNLEPASWHIQLFGPLKVVDPTGNAYGLVSRKASELLAFLALRRNASVDRDVVAEALWPEADVFSARNRLKTTLSKLKAEIPGIPITTHGKRYIELVREQVLVDYETCERRLKWRRSLGGRDRIAFSKQLLAMIQDGLLPELQNEWILDERHRYQALVAELERDIEEEKTDVGAGFRLGDDLGGLNVALIGREQELREILAWLADTSSRECHIVGTPGVGKTRLLREILALAEASCDAIITLSTVQNTETSWLERLGQMLGIRDPRQVTVALTQLLVEYRSPLLALDDLDQANEAMRLWMDELMKLVPNLRLLGTARRHPRATGVRVCQVATLETLKGRDSNDYSSRGETIPLRSATQQGKVLDSATELLVNFALQFDVSERILRRDQHYLAQIAEYLEGLPLALEIAAAWLPLLQPEAFLHRLKTTPELITQTTSAGRLSFAVIVTTLLQELSAEDRSTLLRLSVCRGGCGEDLAEALLGPGWLWRIRTLVDRSLVTRFEGQATNRFFVVQALREAVVAIEGPERTEVERRFWKDACLQLAVRAKREVNEADRAFWLSWIRDEGENVFAAAVEVEDDKLALALETLDGLRPGARLIGLVQGIERAFLELRSRAEAVFPTTDALTPSPVMDQRVRVLLAEHRLNEAVDLATRYRRSLEGSNPERLVHALDLEGETRFFIQDNLGAKECWIRCATLRKQLGYPRHAVWLESKISHAENRLGWHKQGRLRRQQALELAIQVGDLNGEGMYLKEFAAEALEDRDFARAEDLALRSVEAFRRSGESVTTFDALIVLSAVRLARNKFEEARESLSEAQLLEPHGDPISSERLSILLGLLRKRVDSRLFYDHLTIEH